MSIPVIYHPDPASEALLDPVESKHIIRVLRLREGDPVHVADGKGNMFESTIKDANPSACALAVKGIAFTEPENGFHLLVAPTKQMSRYEWMLEKATEMGLCRLTPVICEHSERTHVKRSRLVKTALSAMKQSGRARLPVIDDPISFNDAVQSFTATTKYIATCDDRCEKVKLSGRDKSLMMLIGPEGDFSMDELKTAMDGGFKCVTLGRWRLRTESAAMAACAWYHLQNYA